MSGEDKLAAFVVVALVFILGSVLYILAFVDIPDKNQTLFASIAGGVVGASIMAYINNRYGSSKGSAAKDATIADLTTKVKDA